MQSDKRAWSKSLGDLFEDLEQQAEGLRLSERDAEIAERMQAEYAEVAFSARIHASVSCTVKLLVQGVGTLEGTLSKAGLDWCLVEGGGPSREAIVRLPAVQSAEGLSERAVSPAARSVVTRLGLGSVLRRLSESRMPVVLAHLDGSQTRGALIRVGADFVEVSVGSEDQGRGPERIDLVTFAGLATVRAT